MERAIRLWRSPFSSFGKNTKTPDDMQDETITAEKVYTDEVLKDIAENGLTGIWIHGILKNIVKTDIFPELGGNSGKHIRSLSSIIKKASKYGLRVYLYMQPPRGLPSSHPFWERHPQCGGIDEFVMADDGSERFSVKTFCTSHPDVKTFLFTAANNLVNNLPDLGGVILITASEYTSHCYAHYNFTGKFKDTDPLFAAKEMKCTRCRKRHPVEVVSEIIKLIRDGIKTSSSDTDVIAWNWSWTLFDPDPSPNIIKSLPHDVILMCGFERGDSKIILGKKRIIDEYSLSFPGPSARFTESFKIAKQRGLRVMTKLQIGTTHELASAPNLPLIPNLYKKAKAMKEMKVLDFMGCWNFGNMLTANTSAFNYFITAKELPSMDKALREFAQYYFPGCNSSGIINAWEKFCEAMDNYPFSIPFLYYGVTNYALAYPLTPGRISDKPAGRSWQNDSRGDNLEQSLQGGFTLNETIRCLSKVYRLWRKGYERLKQGLSNCDSVHARDELNTAAIIYHAFRSSWNIYRAYKLKKNWNNTPEQKRQFINIVKNERKNLEKALPILEKDKRCGYHSEAQCYMFDAESVKQKLESKTRPGPQI